MVDSGSEITFVDHEFAEVLGYNIKKGNKTEVVGVGGAHIDVYFHKVGIILDTKSKERPLKSFQN